MKNFCNSVFFCLVFFAIISVSGDYVYGADPIPGAGGGITEPVEPLPGAGGGITEPVEPLPGAGGDVAERPKPKTVELKNPLSVNSIEGLLRAILRIVQIIATPIIAFFIIYAGFLYVTARGKPDQITTANRALLYAIIGGILIIGATVLVEIVSNTVLQFR